MQSKKIEKKFTFSEQERNKLRDVQAGIVIGEAQLDGLHIYKNVFLEGVYRRLGINGDPKKGNSKSITYNLSKNEILYTEEPIKDLTVKKPKN